MALEKIIQDVVFAMADEHQGLKASIIHLSSIVNL